MVRHADSKPIVTKEEVYTHRSLETGSRTMWGSTGSVRRQRWGRLYWDFCGKEWNKRVSPQVRLGLDGLSNSGGLWTIVVVPSGPEPGPGVV